MVSVQEPIECKLFVMQNEYACALCKYWTVLKSESAPSHPLVGSLTCEYVLVVVLLILRLVQVLLLNVIKEETFAETDDIGKGIHFRIISG